MDIQIWEKTILAWVNSLISSTPLRSISQINDSILSEIIKKFKIHFDSGPVEFLKENFPNLHNDDSFVLSSRSDHLCAATLLLIYVSFSTSGEFEEIRKTMCTQLDNSTQVNIAGFLTAIQERFGDVFDLSFSEIKHEIYEYADKDASQNSIIGDCVKTPIKNNVSGSSFDSPLQGFFQTPKRSKPKRQVQCSVSMCGDGDHLKLIKKLTYQLVEEESEKASLQEQLNIHTQKCNEYESKLRGKIEEMKNLKSEWENESKKNESEMELLKKNLMKKLEDEKKLKSDISYLENYVSTLESDLSDSKSKKGKLEFQLKEAMDKCTRNESKLKELSDVNLRLQGVIENKEKELAQLKEDYSRCYKDEKSIDVSYMNGSLDESIHPPESMGVVIEKLLEEKIEENNSLKTVIEELEKKKNNLLNEIKSLNENLVSKQSTVSELEYLNKELNAKVEKFDATEKELFKIQKELVNTNGQISKLVKENSHLSEKYNLLHSTLQEREQALTNFKNSQMLLHVNFVKLAEDLKAIQQRLECEVNNMSRLTSDTEESFQMIEKRSEFLDVIEKRENLSGQDFSKDIESKKQLQSSLFNDEKMGKINELISYFENQNFDWTQSKAAIQNTCSLLNDNIIVLKMKIIELEEHKKKSLKEKNGLEKCVKEAERRISEIESSSVTELKKLKEELAVKESRFRELESLIHQTKKFQDDLVEENEMLKREATKLTKERELRLVHEGGDFATKPNQTRNIQELSDSLEEVPFCNKTFDIVNLDEKNMGDKTFSIKKDVSCANSATWIVSPPSKTAPPPVAARESLKPRRVHGESWIVPLAPAKTSKISSSANDLNAKIENKNTVNRLHVTRSSSLSSILENSHNSPSKISSETSAATSYFSVTDLSCSRKKDEMVETAQNVTMNGGTIRVSPTRTQLQKVSSLESSLPRNFQLTERSDDPLRYIFNQDYRNEDEVKNLLEMRVSELRKEVVEYSKEKERLKAALSESEQKRKRDREVFEKNQEIIKQNISAKFEAQLEHLKSEMKLLHSREISKHKMEQANLNSELREQNKRYKEHIDELRNQLWELGEKLLQEQKMKRDLERNYKELKKKFEIMLFYRDSETKSFRGSDVYHKESLAEESFRQSNFHQMPPHGTFPIIPTEDEDEVFDNRFLEDMKAGLCKVEKPEGRLMELQYRNSLCLPHLKSSYPGETQVHNPTLFKENELKLGLLQFGQESQSLTDSDHSMTKSLLPENKIKKKEQTSYKRPGPPTPSKNGGRLSLQSVNLTPRNVLKELNDQSKGTPNPLKSFLSKGVKGGGGLGSKDENAAPVTPRKKSKFFRKPFGARDH